MSRGDGECYGNAYIERELRYFTSGNSEPKPIKPINHEQPTNRWFFISTPSPSGFPLKLLPLTRRIPVPSPFHCACVAIDIDSASQTVCYRLNAYCVLHPSTWGNPAVIPHFLTYRKMSRRTFPGYHPTTLVHCCPLFRAMITSMIRIYAICY